MTLTVKLSYAKNHTSIGKTYVDVKGTGKFYGTIRKTFYITPAKPYASVKTSKRQDICYSQRLKGRCKRRNCIQKERLKSMEEI